MFRQRCRRVWWSTWWATASHVTTHTLYGNTYKGKITTMLSQDSNKVAISCCCCCCYDEPVRHCLYEGTKRSRRDEEFHQTLNLEGSISPSISSSWETHLRTTGRHLPCIMCDPIWDHTMLPATQHSLNAPALTPARRPVLDLRTPERWKAELT